MPIKKDKKKDKKKGKDKKKIVKQKQAQKQSQSVIVNVIKEKVKRRSRPKPKLEVPVRPTFIQSFQPQPQFNVPTIDQLARQGQAQDQLVRQGQAQGIRLGGREPVAKAEFYEPIQEAISLPFEADSNIGRHIQEPLVPTPPAEKQKPKKSVGAPRKYFTPEEVALAKKEASKRHREKVKRLAEEEAIRKASNQIEAEKIKQDEKVTSNL